MDWLAQDFEPNSKSDDGRRPALADEPPVAP